jgi:hypothetical protein
MPTGNRLRDRPIPSEPSILAWDIRFRSRQGLISASGSALARTHQPQKCSSSSRIDSLYERSQGSGWARHTPTQAPATALAEDDRVRRQRTAARESLCTQLGKPLVMPVVACLSTASASSKPARRLSLSRYLARSRGHSSEWEPSINCRCCPNEQICALAEAAAP